MYPCDHRLLSEIYAFDLHPGRHYGALKLKKKSFFYYEKGSLLQNTTLFKLHISFNLTKHHNHQEKKKKA